MDESPEAKKARTSKSVPMDEDREETNWEFADKEMDFEEMKIELIYDEDDVLPPKRHTMGKNPYAILEDEELIPTKMMTMMDMMTMTMMMTIDDDDDDDNGEGKEIIVTEVKKPDIRDDKSETEDEVEVIEKDTHDHNEDDDEEDEDKGGDTKDNEVVEMMKDAKAPGQQQGTLDAFFQAPLKGPDTLKHKNKHQPQNTKPSQLAKDSTSNHDHDHDHDHNHDQPRPDSKESQHGQDHAQEHDYDLDQEQDNDHDQEFWPQPSFQQEPAFAEDNASDECAQTRVVYSWGCQGDEVFPKHS